MKNVLIVRLDAIGDYILWRNVLAFIRHSAAYRSSRITVLGNPAWRSLAEGFDAALADEWIWVENRRRLFRMGYENLLPGCIWRRRVEKEQARLRERLKARRFDEVLSLQAFPDMQLDALVKDIAPVTIGVASAAPAVCDTGFTSLLDAGASPFVFEKNRTIASSLTGESCEVPFELRLSAPVEKRNEVMFFLGASHWTKRWPKKRWDALAQLVQKQYHCSVRYAGLPGEQQRPLTEFAAGIAAARAVVSNDTMALHLAAALDVPVVGVVNGVTGRGGFWPYPAALGKQVTVAEPRCRFDGFLPGLLGRQIAQYRALASIGAEDVMSAIQLLLSAE